MFVARLSLLGWLSSTTPILSLLHQYAVYCYLCKKMYAMKKKKEKDEEIPDRFRSYEDNLVRWQRRSALIGAVLAALYTIIEWLIEKLS